MNDNDLPPPFRPHDRPPFPQQEIPLHPPPLEADPPAPPPQPADDRPPDPFLRRS